MQADFRANPFAGSGKHLLRGYDAMQKELDRQDYGNSHGFFPEFVTKPLEKIGRSLVSALAAPFAGFDTGENVPDWKGKRTVSGNAYGRLKTKKIDNGKVFGTTMPGGRGRRGRGGKKGMRSGPTRKEIKKEVKKDVRRALGRGPITRWGRGGLRSRGVRQNTSQGFVPRSGVVTAPFARGPQYAGSRSTIATMRSQLGVKMNCTRMKTRNSIGKLQVYTVSSVATTSLQPNGTNELGGQWFFAPTMQIYWPINAQPVNMSSMYQYFYLNNVWFEFESMFQPGNTTNYQVVYALIENPNLGETCFPDYTTTTSISPTFLLQNPYSGSWPAYKPKHVIKIPPKWYRGQRYVTRSYTTVGPVDTSDSAMVAQNIQNIPFGIWLAVDGPAPGSTIPICRVFVHFDIELCELAVSQTYGNTGSSSATISSTPAKELKNLRSQLSDLKLEITDIRRKMVIPGDDDFIPESPRSVSRLDQRAEPGRLDGIKLEHKERKSASNKSNK